MKFLQKRQNEKSFTKSDYVVLSYEHLPRCMVHTIVTVKSIIILMPIKILNNCFIMRDYRKKDKIWQKY